MRPTSERPQAAARKPVLTTMHADDDQHWNAWVDVIRVSEHPGLPRWLRAFWSSSAGRSAVFVRGTVAFHERYRDLLGIALLKLRRRRPLVVVSDATLEPGSRAL